MSHHPTKLVANTEPNQTEPTMTTTRRILTTLTAVAVVVLVSSSASAWVSPFHNYHHHHHQPNAFQRRSTTSSSSSHTHGQSTSSRSTPLPMSAVEMSAGSSIGSLHGDNSCFLPLKQLDQDYFAPRIVQIAGAYPGLTKEEFMAVKSEPAPEPGQWTYDFSDPDGPQLGTVAIEGNTVVAMCDDPVVVIAEHTSLGVPLPKAITEAVDLVVLVDRAATGFADRKFLLLALPGSTELTIGAFPTKSDLPEGAEIMGQVVLCQIPWLPSMKPTKSGFLEVDEYY